MAGSESRAGPIHHTTPQLLAPLFRQAFGSKTNLVPEIRKIAQQPIRPDTMASMITRRFFSTTVRRLQTSSKQELQAESKRNPEIYVRHN